MPKRDEHYMKQQRELLAQAALDCLLQKGLAETSMRDVAERANVSLGALYVHFSDKNQLLLAAGQIMQRRTPVKPCNKWSEYLLNANKFKRELRSGKYRKTVRLTFQMLADLVMNENLPPGYAEEFAISLNTLENQLRILHQSGEISLPLGLEQTAYVHLQLSYGIIATSIWIADAEMNALFRSYFATLALTAGYRKTNRVRKSK